MNLDPVSCKHRLIGGERVTCHGLNITNSLGRTKLINSLGNSDLNFRLACETSANLYAGRVKQVIFTQSWQLNDFKQEVKKKLNSFYATKARNSLTKF